MSEIWLPSDHPEFCPAEDVTEQRRLSRVAAKVDYLQECADLRASVFQLMRPFCSQDATDSWALFYLDDSDDADTGTGLLQNRNEILVMLMTQPAAKILPMPIRNIRIFTKEHFQMPEGMAYFCIDFTLDYENDTLYRIGAVTQGDDGVFTVGSKLTPMFGITDGSQITADNLYVFTPVDGVEAAVSGSTVRPFGVLGGGIDELYALSVGRSLVRSIASLEPVYHGTL